MLFQNNLIHMQPTYVVRHAHAKPRGGDTTSIRKDILANQKAEECGRPEMASQQQRCCSAKETNSELLLGYF